MAHKGMKFGIFLAPFHRIGENPTLALSRDMELIEWLDYLGYDEVWVGEHHSAGWELIASPEVFIAAAAERTRHIMLGSGVTSLPYHHPLLVAQRFVQLDHMTRGRSMLGCGPGALVSDAYMLGIEPVTQRPRMDEALDAIMLLLRCEEPEHDGVERLVHPRALGHRLDAEHVGVGDERARSAAEHRAAARHVVELHEALRHQKRVVIRQARHARAEHDVTRTLGGGGDEDFRRRDQLPARRVMLAHPHLVVAEVVEPLDELHVTGESQRGVLADPVKRGQEDAEFHSLVGHGALILARCGAKRPGGAKPRPECYHAAP